MGSDREETTACARCGRRVRLDQLCLQTYGFLWLRMRLVCRRCYDGERSAGDGE